MHQHGDGLLSAVLHDLCLSALGCGSRMPVEVKQCIVTGLVRVLLELLEQCVVHVGIITQKSVVYRKAVAFCIVANKHFRSLLFAFENIRH